MSAKQRGTYPPSPLHPVSFSFLPRLCFRVRDKFIDELLQGLAPGIRGTNRPVGVDHEDGGVAGNVIEAGDRSILVLAVVPARPGHALRLHNLGGGVLGLSAVDAE